MLLAFASLTIRSGSDGLDASSVAGGRSGRERAGLLEASSILLIALWSGNAFAQNPPVVTPGAVPPATAGTGLPAEAAGAFSRASRQYADGAAHASHFVQIYTPAGFTTARRESGSVWIQAPQRVRFDYDAPEKKTFTYDAGEGRLFTPEDKQLSIQKLRPEERARLPIVFLSDAAELAREYALSAEPGEDGATRVLMKPRTPRSELAWLRLNVAKEGLVSDLSYEDASGNRTEFRFEGWRKEKPRPAADYRVTGPPGTRILQN